MAVPDHGQFFPVGLVKVKLVIFIYFKLYTKVKE
jgi:hypothetical protein